MIVPALVPFPVVAQPAHQIEPPDPLFPSRVQAIHGQGILQSPDAFVVEQLWIEFSDIRAGVVVEEAQFRTGRGSQHRHDIDALRDRVEIIDKEAERAEVARAGDTFRDQVRHFALAQGEVLRQCQAIADRNPEEVRR